MKSVGGVRVTQTQLKPTYLVLTVHCKMKLEPADLVSDLALQNTIKTRGPSF
jgi:hypothetical protein